MNLYLLEIRWENFKNDEWDKFHGFVIASGSPKETRQIADHASIKSDETRFDLETGKYYIFMKEEHPESNHIWLKPKYTKLNKIGTAAKNIKRGIVFDKWING